MFTCKSCFPNGTLELPFMINAFYVFVGEFVVLVIGAILFKCLEKNKTLMNNYILE